MEKSYGGTPPVEAPEEAEPAESVDEENAGTSEILIAKTELPSGTKEGDTCTFKVVKDFGNEFSLEYVKESPAPGEQTADNMETTTANEITAMDEKGM